MNSKLLQEWKLHIGEDKNVPPAMQLIKFGDKRSVILSSSENDGWRDSRLPSQPTPKTSYSLPHNKRSVKQYSTLHASVLFQCRLCQNGDHSLQQCHIFRESDVDARIRTVQTLQVCYNCLGLDHNSWQCYSKRTCKECGKKHHTLLHKPIGQTTSEGKAPTSAIVATQLTSESSLTATIPQQTALVWSCQVMLDVNGKKQQVRAMIDPGSTLSFVTGRIATALRATRIPFTTSISGLNQSHAATSFFKIDTTLNSGDDNEITPIKMSPSVVTSITSITPASDITKNKNLGFTKDLKLADPEFGTPGKIDLPIGQDVIHEILKGESLMYLEHHCMPSTLCLDG